MVQVRRPRGDGDPAERGEVERGVHPVLLHARLVIRAAPQAQAPRHRAPRARAPSARAPAAPRALARALAALVARRPYCILVPVLGRHLTKDNGTLTLR